MKTFLIICSIILSSVITSYAQQEVITKYPDGNIKERYMVDKKGNKNGVYTSYYQNGKQSLTVSYKNGLKHGPYTAWHENGNKSDEGSYLDNNRDGMFSSYSEEGRLMEQIVFGNGKILSKKEY
jgi:antitoxin component YwqK of YwqJK toxin-antitoxin module